MPAGETKAASIGAPAAQPRAALRCRAAIMLVWRKLPRGRRRFSASEREASLFGHLGQAFAKTEARPNAACCRAVCAGRKAVGALVRALEAGEDRQTGGRRNGLRAGRPKSRSPHPHGDRCAKEKDRSNLPSFFVHILRSAPDFPARPIRSAPETATSGRSGSGKRTRPRGTASRRPSRRKRRPRRSSAAAPAPDSARCGRPASTRPK